MTPLPRPSWTVAIRCSRAFEQPLLNSGCDFGVGCPRTFPQKLCADHLHAELRELKGDFDTGLVARKHGLILLQRVLVRSAKRR